jgi:hypothetical protein
MKFIEAVIDTWNILSKNEIQSKILRVDDDSKLLIEINNSKYIATIEAYEKINFMDICALELSSNKEIVLSVGECSSLDEMKERITLFCEMLSHV